MLTVENGRILTGVSESGCERGSVLNVCSQDLRPLLRYPKGFAAIDALLGWCEVIDHMDRILEI